MKIIKFGVILANLKLLFGEGGAAKSVCEGDNPDGVVIVLQ